MTVLSDHTIRRRMEAGDLIVGGESQHAVHCCYEFTAAVLFRGSNTQPEAISSAGSVIGPAELVWVRAKETIALPAGNVGIWIQTQSLSRQGLLLLNTTLIEPGYHGPLTAVLVNFGSRNVVIGPASKIAKVLFLPLDQDALVTVPPADPLQYDNSILQMSANAPKTFLQIEQMLPNLERETESRLAQIDQRLAAAQASLDNRLALAEHNLLDTLTRELRQDVTKHGVRWLGGLAVGFVAASLAVWFAVGVVFPQLVTHYSNFDTSVNRAVQLGQSPVLEQLRTDLRNSRAELDQLKQDLADLKRRKDEPTKTPTTERGHRE